MRCVSLSAAVVVALLPLPVLAVTSVGATPPQAAPAPAIVADAPRPAAAGVVRSWGGPVSADVAAAPAPMPVATAPSGWQRFKRGIANLGQRFGQMFGS